MGAKLLEPLPAAFPRPLLRATPRPRAEARTATAPVMAPPMDAALAGRVFGAEWLPRALPDGVRDGRRLVAPPTPIRDPPPATPPPWWPGPLTELPLQLRAAGADATAGADTLPLLAPNRSRMTLACLMNHAHHHVPRSSPPQTFEVKCDSKADVAEQLFNALRAEMKRVDQQQKDFRKDKRSANNSIAARDYWKQPLDHGQVNKKE